MKAKYEEFNNWQGDILSRYLTAHEYASIDAAMKVLHVTRKEVAERANRWWAARMRTERMKKADTELIGSFHRGGRK